MTEPITVAVSGAKGRMGREVVAAVQAEGDLRLVAEVDAGDDLAAAPEAAGGLTRIARGVGSRG